MTVGGIVAPAETAGLAAVLEWRSSTEPDRRFVKCSTGWRTFAEVEAAAERLARGLAALGVRKGDRVGVISDNRDEVIDLFFACAKLGAIEVSFNTFLKGDFLAYQLIDADLTVVVADAPGCRRLRPILPDADVRIVVALDDVDTDLSPAAVHPYADVASSTADRDAVEVTVADIMAILYTSGTTGQPKGCMLPHGYFRHAPTQYFTDRRFEPGDLIFCAFPFFHTSGQVYVLMLALFGPCQLVIAPSFSASNFMKEAKAEGTTRLVGVAAMGAAILAQPPDVADAEPSTIKSAAWLPFKEHDQLAFETRFGIPTYGEGFGQTECMPICHTAVDGPRDRRACGLPVDDLDLMLMDDDGNEVPRGTVGEIVVRPKGPHMMFAGYWRKPEASLEAMQHYWHHTGDFGRQDEQGFVHFVDRKKQAIRRRGENISSLELEAAIRKHRAVLDVAVHAVPSPMSEDDVKAVLVVHEGAQVEPTELFEYFKENLPYFAVPRYVELRESLPINALGRVMKHVLREEGITESTWDLEALGLVITKAERR